MYLYVYIQVHVFTPAHIHVCKNKIVFSSALHGQKPLDSCNFLLFMCMYTTWSTCSCVCTQLGQLVHVYVHNLVDFPSPTHNWSLSNLAGKLSPFTHEIQSCIYNIFLIFFYLSVTVARSLSAPPDDMTLRPYSAGSRPICKNHFECLLLYSILMSYVCIYIYTRFLLLVFTM
jgi:hypothetical protein